MIDFFSTTIRRMTGGSRPKLPVFVRNDPPPDASVDDLRAALAALASAHGSQLSAFRSLAEILPSGIEPAERGQIEANIQAIGEAEAALKVRIYEAERAAEPLNRNPAVAAIDDQLRQLSAELAVAKAQWVAAHSNESKAATLDDKAAALVNGNKVEPTQYIEALRDRISVLERAIDLLNERRSAARGEAIAELASQYLPGLDQRLVEAAKHFTAFMKVSQDVYGYLQTAGSEIGVDLNNEYSLPLPAWFRVMAFNGYVRMPHPDKHREAVAAMIENISRQRPTLAAELNKILVRFDSPSASHEPSPASSVRARAAGKGR